MARTVLADKPKLPRHPPRRGALAGLPHRIFEALAEGRFARQQRHLLGLHPAVRAAHPVQFDAPQWSWYSKQGKIAHFPLVGLDDGAHRSPATGTDQLLVAAFAPHPQLQRLGRLIDLRPVNLVSRPPQDLRPVVLPHTAESIEKPLSLKTPSIALSAKFLRRALFSYWRRARRLGDGRDGGAECGTPLLAGSPGGRRRREAQGHDPRDRHGGSGRRGEGDTTPGFGAGDIINLAAGDMIPGDVRLLTSKDLFVSQGSLTGESLPVEKIPRSRNQRGELTH